MTGDLLDTTSRCLSCGAELPANAAFCPACGNPIESFPEETGKETDESGKDLNRLVEESNQNLFKRGAEAAEAAFGLGCSLGAILSGLLLVILFLVGVRNWIILGIAAFGAAILTTGISAFLALQARSNALKRTYDKTVNPQINQYLQAHQMTRPEFDALARVLIPGGSPLRTYITSPDQLEGLDTED